MFGRMRAEPILRVKPACPAGEAVTTLTKATDGTQALRWIEFPAAVLLFVIVAGDPQWRSSCLGAEDRNLALS